MKVKIDLIAWDKKKVLSKELENWNYTAQVSLDWLLEKGGAGGVHLRSRKRVATLMKKICKKIASLHVNFSYF
jgi:hypothetical protein